MNGETTPELPTMSRGLKIALAIGLYPTFVWAVLLFILAFSGFFENDANETLRRIALGISYPAVIAHGLAVLYSIIWVVRHLRGNERVGWGIGIFVGGSLAALIWWWVVIRPLPEPAR